MKERVKRAGFRLIATSRLPEAGWWDNYYVPMLARTAELRKTHGTVPENAALLDSLEEEADTYRKIQAVLRVHVLRDAECVNSDFYFS